MSSSAKGKQENKRRGRHCCIKTITETSTKVWETEGLMDAWWVYKMRDKSWFEQHGGKKYLLTTVAAGMQIIHWQWFPNNDLKPTVLVLWIYCSYLSCQVWFVPGLCWHSMFHCVAIRHLWQVTKKCTEATNVFVKLTLIVLWLCPYILMIPMKLYALWEVSHRG